MNQNVVSITVQQDHNVGGYYARARLADQQERDIPLTPEEAHASDGYIRYYVALDPLVGAVEQNCSVDRIDI